MISAIGYVCATYKTEVKYFIAYVTESLRYWKALCWRGRDVVMILVYTIDAAATDADVFNWRSEIGCASTRSRRWRRWWRVCRPVSLFIHVCASAFMSVCRSLPVFLCLSGSDCLCQALSAFIRLSVSVCLTLSLSVCFYLSFCLCMSVRLYLWLFVCVCDPLCLSLYLNSSVSCGCADAWSRPISRSKRLLSSVKMATYGRLKGRWTGQWKVRRNGGSV